MNVRDTEGLVVGKRVYTYKKKVPVPSFGPDMDEYMDMHGFQIETILQIAHAFKEAGDVDKFVELMESFGMLEIEAQWLHSKITKAGGKQGQCIRPTIDTFGAI